jgi:hypothetical protein
MVFGGGAFGRHRRPLCPEVYGSKDIAVEEIPHMLRIHGAQHCTMDV